RRDAGAGGGVPGPLRALPQPERQGAHRLGRAGGDRRAAAPRHPGELHLLHVVQPGDHGGGGGGGRRGPVLGGGPRRRVPRRGGGSGTSATTRGRSSGRCGRRCASGTARRRSSWAASGTSPT